MKMNLALLVLLSFLLGIYTSQAIKPKENVIVCDTASWQSLQDIDDKTFPADEYQMCSINTVNGKPIKVVNLD